MRGSDDSGFSNSGQHVRCTTVLPSDCAMPRLPAGESYVGRRPGTPCTAAAHCKSGVCTDGRCAEEDISSLNLFFTVQGGQPSARQLPALIRASQEAPTVPLITPPRPYAFPGGQSRPTSVLPQTFSHIVHGVLRKA